MVLQVQRYQSIQPYRDLLVEHFLHYSDGGGKMTPIVDYHVETRPPKKKKIVCEAEYDIDIIVSNAMDP